MSCPVCLPVSWKEFAPEGFLLRFAEVAKIQEDRFQQRFDYVLSFPSCIEVVWEFLVCDKAPVEVDFQASGLTQASQSSEQALQQVVPVRTGAESPGCLLPCGIVNAWRQVAIGLERWNHRLYYPVWSGFQCKRCHLLAQQLVCSGEWGEDHSVRKRISGNGKFPPKENCRHARAAGSVIAARCNQLRSSIQWTAAAMRQPGIITNAV